MLLCIPEWGNAQAIRLDFEADGLEQALFLFNKQTNIDVVFATRLVQDRKTSCHYAGTDSKQALQCILSGTGIEATWARSSQVVLKARSQPIPKPTRIHSKTTPFTYSGRIIDSDDGTPLPGVHVVFVDQPGGIITDRSGLFTLKNHTGGPQHLKISHLGYGSIEVYALPSQKQFTIALSPVALEGDEVVVEADLDEDEAFNVVPGTVPILSRKAERSKAFTDVADWFESVLWLPSVQRSKELGGNLSIRGGLPSQNLFLLDGVPIYQPWHAEGRFSILQSDALEDVRLYTGSMPAAYGGRLSAVIDAKMDDGLNENPRFSGEITSSSAQLSVAAPVTQDRQTALVITGRQSFNGLPEHVQNTSGRVPLENVSFYDFSAKLTSRIHPSHLISISTYRSEDNLEIEGASLPASIGLQGRYRWHNQLYSLQHRYVYNANILWTTTLYKSQYESRDLTNAVTDQPALNFAPYTMQVHDTGLNVTVDYILNGAHKIQAGFQAVSHKFTWPTEGSYDLTGIEAIESSAYVQDSWRPFERFQVQPGLRIGMFGDGTYLNVLPRLNASYTAHSQYLILKGGLSRQVQYIHQLQRADSDYAFSQWLAAGTQNIEPSLGSQVTVGLESRPTPRLMVTADLYWRHFSHVLLPVSEHTSGKPIQSGSKIIWALAGKKLENDYVQPYSPGVTKAYGIELIGSYVLDSWRLWGSYVGSRSRIRPFTTTGLSPHIVAQYDVPHTFRGALSHQGHHWTATLTGEVRSGYLKDPTMIYEHTGNQRLPVYLRLDTSIGYRFQAIGLKWHPQLQIYNLLNRKNVVGYRYESTGSYLDGLSRWITFRVKVDL